MILYETNYVYEIIHITHKKFSVTVSVALLFYNLKIMICPHCNIQMTHLNKWDGFSWTDAYQTYDYVQCDNCKAVAIEVYHTEFITTWLNDLPKIKIDLIYNK